MAWTPSVSPLPGGDQVPDELRVLAEHLHHLGVELIEVEPVHGVDQKGPGDGHQADHQQNHNQHQFNVQAAQRGSPPLCPAGSRLLLEVVSRPPAG